MVRHVRSPRFDKKLLQTEAVKKLAEKINSTKFVDVNPAEFCDFDGCKERHCCRHLCRHHYSVFRYAGLISPLQNDLRCQFPSCTKKANVREYCTFHYQYVKHENRPGPQHKHYLKNKNNPEVQERRKEVSTRYKKSVRGRFTFGWQQAKKRSLIWLLSFEDYAALVLLPCHYCAAPPEIRYGVGLDRKDNTLGYTKENTTPCCWYCNRIKSDLLTEAEMLALMAHLRELRGGNVWHQYS